MHIQICIIKDKFMASKSISMASSTITIAIFSLLLLFSPSSAVSPEQSPTPLVIAVSPETSATPQSVAESPETSSTPSTIAKSTVPKVIVGACRASRDPETCARLLTDSGIVSPDASALQVIQSTISLTFRNLEKAKSMVEDILAGLSGNQNLTTAARICKEVLLMSRYRIALASHDGLVGQKIKDGRAWLSAALGYQYDSWSALKKNNDTLEVVNTMDLINGTIMPLTSTALNMLGNYDVHGENVGAWGPIKTERDGYWEPVEVPGDNGFDFDGGVPKGLKPHVTVCLEGGCDFTSVQEAVNVAPNMEFQRLFVIWIKAGVYRQLVRVPMKKLNVVFLGDGMGKTVISGSRHAGQLGMSTYQSATVGVLGDGFMASNLTFENTGVGHQAVAFRSDSDRTVIETCEFIGNQDTLYAKSTRQYYKSCRIIGNVDFIFGNSAAFFKDCEILITKRPVEPEKGAINAVTALGRIDPAQTIGFVFHNCTVNGTEEYVRIYKNNPEKHHNYLGRPWKEYSRTVFIRCNFGFIISKEGWYPWDGDFALKTLYYGEFENTGVGADTSGRVNWSSIIPANHVDSYSVQNFIQGDLWIPK